MAFPPESPVRAHIESQLAEAAVWASVDGDRAALSEIVSYLADDIPALVNVFSLALDIARVHPHDVGRPVHRR